MTSETQTQPQEDAMQAEVRRMCGGCGKPVTHANQASQRGFDTHEPQDFVCIDQRVGFLHEGECCRCFDARTWPPR